MVVSVCLFYCFPLGDGAYLFPPENGGLPAGLDEVQVIERAREKRVFEAMLPPITDEASFDARRRLLQEQELREWNEREDAIAKLKKHIFVFVFVKKNVVEFQENNIYTFFSLTTFFLFIFCFVRKIKRENSQRYCYSFEISFTTKHK